MATNLRKTVNSKGIKTMKTLVRSIILLSTVAINVALSASLVSAKEIETMQDKCSSDVAFVPRYDDNPGVPGTIVLKRGVTADWTPDFQVETNKKGYIRWWCHSTKGNLLDPGTWRPKFDTVKTVACAGGALIYAFDPNSDIGKKGLEQCQGAIQKFDSSAWQDWTPERSRCSNRSKKIRARLDSNRKLEIQCPDN